MQVATLWSLKSAKVLSLRQSNKLALRYLKPRVILYNILNVSLSLLATSLHCMYVATFHNWLIVIMHEFIYRVESFKWTF